MRETATPSRSDPWAAFLHEGLLRIERPVENAAVEFASTSIGGDPVPLAINRGGSAACSWVASLRNAIGPYARAEIALVQTPPALRPILHAASHAAESLLRAGGLSGGSFLANWMLSTNLLPSSWTAPEILNAAESVARTESRLPVILRSLAPRLHGKLLVELAQGGFLLMPTRQVWLVDAPAGAWRRRRDARNDAALISSGDDWEWITGDAFTAADITRARELYLDLYREKYPRHNPAYSRAYVEAGVQTGFIRLHGLRRAGAATLSGFYASCHRRAITTSPLLGYDLSESADGALYRRLCRRIWEEAEKRGELLHCSAGAGAFKASRGAVPEPEFAAIWANHLPLYRRAALKNLCAAANRWLVPYVATHRF